MLLDSTDYQRFVKLNMLMLSSLKLFYIYWLTKKDKFLTVQAFIKLIWRRSKPQHICSMHKKRNICILWLLRLNCNYTPFLEPLEPVWKVKLLVQTRDVNVLIFRYDSVQQKYKRLKRYVAHYEILWHRVTLRNEFEYLIQR